MKWVLFGRRRGEAVGGGGFSLGRLEMRMEEKVLNLKILSTTPYFLT